MRSRRSARAIVRYQIALNHWRDECRKARARPGEQQRAALRAPSSGYKGRTGLFEVLVLNDELARMIVAGTPESFARICVICVICG